MMDKTYTCAKCGQVGFDFSDMAKEECPNDLGNGHEIPIFGDMKTGEAYDFTENDIEKARSGWDGADEDTRKKVIQVMYAGSKPPFDDLHTFSFDRLPDYIQQEFTRNHAHESSYYGYGSTTGRMSPAEHWKQGLDAYGDMGYDSKLHTPMYDEFSGMNFSELPDDIKSAYLNKHGYRDTTIGEGIVNSDNYMNFPDDETAICKLCGERFGEIDGGYSGVGIIEDHLVNNHGFSRNEFGQLTESYAMEYESEKANFLHDVERYVNNQTCSVCDTRGDFEWNVDNTDYDYGIKEIKTICNSCGNQRRFNMDGESFEDRDWKFRVIDWFNAMSDDKKSANGLPVKHWDDLGGSEHDVVYAKAKQFGFESKASERAITQDVVDWFDNMSPNEKIRYATGSTRFEDLDNVEKSNVQQQYYYIHGESYASEDSLVKIEDDDDKDTKVTVLDEWKNETDPDVGGDVKGLDQAELKESELKDRYKCNVCDNNFDELFYSQYEDQGMCPFCGSTYVEEFNVENFVDYSEIGESKTARTKYECEFCNSGFKSNESLSIHYNDIHAVPPTPIEGYENWKDIANDLYKKELGKKSKKLRGEGYYELDNEEDVENARRGMKMNVDQLNKSEKDDGTDMNFHQGFDWQEGKEGYGDLLQSQKRILDDFKSSHPNASSVDDVPYDIYEKLEQIKDSEFLWSAVDSYMWAGEAKPKMGNLSDVIAQINDKYGGEPEGGWTDDDKVGETYTDDEIEAHKKTGGSYPASWLEASNKMEAQAHPDPDSFPHDPLSQEGFQQGLYGYVDAKCKTCGVEFDSIPDMDDHYKNNPDHESNIGDLNSAIPNTESFKEECFNVDGQQIDCDTGEVIGDGFSKSDAYNKFLYESGGYNPEGDTEEAGRRMREEKEWYDDHSDELDEEQAKGGFDWQFKGEAYAEEEGTSDGAKKGWLTRKGSTFMIKRKNTNEDDLGSIWKNADSDTLKQWMKDQKNNPEQSDNYKAVKKVLEDRGVSVESFANESDFQCPYCKSHDISSDKHDYFKCNNCDRGFDVPYEDPEFDAFEVKTKFQKAVELYASEDDYQYDFDELTSLAQDKLDDEGVSQDEWDESSEEEKKDIEEQVKEAYNPDESICPECGDKTTSDKEFDDHLASHRFDTGDY